MQDSIPGPRDHDLSGRQMLNQLSHPGVPVNCSFCSSDNTFILFSYLEDCLARYNILG